MTQGIVETAAGSDNDTGRQCGCSSRAQIRTICMTCGACRSIGDVRAFMGRGAAKPRLWRMRCCCVAAEAVFPAHSGSAVVRAVAVSTEGHTVGSRRSRFCVSSMGCRGTPARRVPGWSLRMTCDAVSVGTKTADFADSAGQISSVALLACAGSSQIRSRMVPAA